MLLSWDRALTSVISRKLTSTGGTIEHRFRAGDKSPMLAFLERL